MGIQDNYKEILTEDLSGKLDAVLEIMQSFAGDVPIIKQKVTSLEEKFDNIEMRTGILESAVEMHSHQIKQIQKLLPA